MTTYKQTYTPSRRTMTIPNQGLTVADILNRFTRGQALPLFRQSHDDPQGLSEDEQMQLYECEDEFDRRDVLLSIEEGVFNDPHKASAASEAFSNRKPDSEVVEKPSVSVDSSTSNETNS